MKYLITVLSFGYNFLFSFTADAQLCQGSLGPPILQTTFGTGANPGPPLATSSTNYTYVATDCPSDGFYTVRNSSTGCFGNTWHTLSGDRSGDPNGYFMLVNASFTPGDFYVDTVRGICSGTTFEFAAWVINMLRPSFCTPPILPNLTFRIERTDGTLIQSYNTGNIASVSSAQWQQIGFFFTTPAGVTDVVLRITNNASGGCGNDLALDDITFRPCGPLLNTSIAGQPGRTISFCEGPAQQYTLNCAVSSGFTNPSFQWQQSLNGAPYSDMPGTNSTSLNVFFPPGSVPGVYSYRLVAAEAGNISNASCRIASQPLVFTIDSTPDPTVVSNSPVCSGGTLNLSGTGGGQYNWSGPGGFTATTATADILNAPVTASGRYYLEIISSAGCTGIDSIDVVINPSPNASIAPANVVICAGNSVQLNAGGGASYLWSPVTGLSSAISNNPIASPSQTTNYQVVVSNGLNCSDTAFSLVTVQNTASANAGPDKVTIGGIPVQLNGLAGGNNISFSWSPVTYLDNISSLNPVLTAPPGEYTYELTVSSSCGTATDFVKVVVYKDLFIPTAFTPNNDGRNDTWLIAALTAYKEFNILVYNRYGQLVYSTNKSDKGWDGRFKGELQPGGIYVYTIKTGSGNNERTYKGTITLIR